MRVKVQLAQADYGAAFARGVHSKRRHDLVVSVMQTSEPWPSYNPVARCLDGLPLWELLPHAPVSGAFVIVADVIEQDPFRATRIHREDMVEQFAAELPTQRSQLYFYQGLNASRNC